MTISDIRPALSSTFQTLGSFATVLRIVIFTADFFNMHFNIGVRGGALGSGTALKAGRSRVRFSMGF
jgi:hypothetical protein